MKDYLTAGDICTRIVTIGSPDMPLQDAARLMRERHVGCLVVVQEASADERIVVGVLTDRDIALGVVAAGLDARGMRVTDVMTGKVCGAREEDALLDLLAMMRRRRVRRLPVTGPHGELIGIVSLDDVLEVIAQQVQAAAAAVLATAGHEATAPN